MFRNDTFDGLWLEDRSNSDVYMDDSIYKGVGDVVSRQPPPMQTRGRTFVVGDSQLEGMRRFFAKDPRFESKNISYHRGASYKKLKSLAEEFAPKKGDKLIFASFGGNEAKNKYEESINNILPYLKDLKRSGVDIQIFGPPIGDTDDAERVNRRRSLDNFQKEILKPFNYNSIFDQTKNLKANKGEVHYRGAYGKYYNDVIVPRLGSKPTQPKVASASASTAKPAQPAGTRNPARANPSKKPKGNYFRGYVDAETNEPAYPTAMTKLDDKGRQIDDSTGRILKPAPAKKPAQTAPAQTAGTRNPAPAQTAPAQPATQDLSRIPPAMRKYDALVSKYSKAYGVPKALTYAIMRQESGGKREDAGVPRFKKLEAFKKANAHLSKEQQRAKWKALPENNNFPLRRKKGEDDETYNARYEQNRRVKQTFDQGLGIMQSLRSTFIDTSKRMKRAGIKLDYDPANPTMAQHLDPENNIRASAFMIREKMDLIREEYPDSKNDHEKVVYLTGAAYIGGDGGRRSFVRKMTKNHGKDFRKWPNRGGHSRSGYGTGAVNLYREYNAGESPKLKGPSVAPPPINIKVARGSAAPKAPAPKAPAPKAPAPKAPAPKASEPARLAPKPAPKAKSKISQPKVGPGERLVYPRRTSTSHPTKYRGRPRVQKVPKQGKISFGEYKRPNQERDRKEYQRMLDRLPQLPTPDPIKVEPVERENLEGKTLLNIPKKGPKDPLDKLKNKYRNREGGEGYQKQILEAPKRKPSSMMASGRPKPSPVDRFTAQSSARPKTTASAGQRAMEQISSVKQQPTKRPSRFKSESFTPTRTV